MSNSRPSSEPSSIDSDSLPKSQIQQTVVGGHTFSISDIYDFSNGKILGLGSYGVVASAMHVLKEKTLAVKRIRPYANDEWDAKHALREIRVLKLLSPHPNIITLFDLSIFEEKSELYMVLELMDCDLSLIIDSKQTIGETHVKCFAKQMLEGIKAMHSIGIFHRDLKPGNILVTKTCELRITDFGFARFMDSTTLSGDNDENPMTEYVVTRWYRSPELLLAPFKPYTAAVDMWSIGCIIAELVTRNTLFPGKTQAMQVQMIFELMGYANVGELGFRVDNEVSSFLRENCLCDRKDMKEALSASEKNPKSCNPSDDCVEFISSLLQVNPKRRPTAAESLSHPFLHGAKCFYDYSKGPFVIQPQPGYFDFDSAKNSLAELRRIIKNEVSHRDAVIANSPPQLPARNSSVTSLSSRVSFRAISRRSFDGTVPDDGAATVARQNISQATRHMLYSSNRDDSTAALAEAKSSRGAPIVTMSDMRSVSQREPRSVSTRQSSSSTTGSASSTVSSTRRRLGGGNSSDANENIVIAESLSATKISVARHQSKKDVEDDDDALTSLSKQVSDTSIAKKAALQASPNSSSSERQRPPNPQRQNVASRLLSGAGSLIMSFGGKKSEEK